jgi:hypothetical protein
MDLTEIGYEVVDKIHLSLDRVNTVMNILIS